MATFCLLSLGCVQICVPNFDCNNGKWTNCSCSCNTTFLSCKDKHLNSVRKDKPRAFLLGTSDAALSLMAYRLV